MVNPLAHKARVQGLYKRCLKEFLNWGYQREVFYDAAEQIRAQFEEKKHLDMVQGERLAERLEAYLDSIQHPDPLIAPYMHGGTMYARNPPFPPGLSQQLDFGRETQT